VACAGDWVGSAIASAPGRYLERKLGHNKAAVALANKLVRITWAVWKHDRTFEPVPELQAA
jgi:hypothetical protein